MNGFLMSLHQLLPVFILIWLVAAIYTTALGVYRLFLHPLRKFPGPKAAAATYWYEFYHDVLYQGGGQYYKKVKLMHERYGPIVRITPNEIHVDDPDWFDVYIGHGNGQIREKYGPAAKMAGTSLGVFGTADYRKHRLRRNAIAHFFSKRSIRTLEPMIKSKIDKLCKTLRYQAERSEKRTVELRTPLLAFGTDVICDFALGTSPHGELLLDVEKQKQWRNTIYSLEDVTPIGKQFSWCIGFAKHIPVWFLNLVWPDIGRLMQLHKSMGSIAKDMALSSRDEETGKSPSRNVFEAILGSCLPWVEKSHQRLADEGFELIAAGGETVARTASTTMFHLLSNPNALNNVRVELDSVLEGGFEHTSLLVLERLPWLSAVIKESLRVGATISSRLPLVSPQKEVTYDTWVIPPGTPFSMSPSSMLNDARCFKDPYLFKPERWLVEGDQFLRVNKYFVPFSRGTRNCLGMNLAYAELYLVVASLVSRFDLEVSDTFRERDIDHARDCFVGKPAQASDGVKVRLRPRGVLGCRIVTGT